MPRESKEFHGLTFTDHWIRTPGSAPPLGTGSQRQTLDYLEPLYRNAWENAGAGEERRSRLALGHAEILFGLERHEDALDWAQASLGYAPTTAQRLKAAAMLREGGQLDGAEEVLRIAVSLDPEHLRAHFDLGSIAAQRGRHENALVHYERALAIRNDFAEGHLGLATSLRRLNRLAEALAHYREANRLAPRNPAVLEGMAWVLATHPDAASRAPHEALELAEEASAATGYRNPVVLDTLGAAFAASGDFETAANAVRKAIELVETAGATESLPQMQGRLAAYESRAAYVSPRR